MLESYTFGLRPNRKTSREAPFRIEALGVVLLQIEGRELKFWVGTVGLDRANAA